MAIHVWPTPTCVQDVRSFLGLCNFYQRFVPEYATISAPLTDLEKKGLEWNWTDVEQQAFEKLKSKLLKSPVLIVPDPAKPYVLHTDASDVGIGAVLSQEDEDGQLSLEEAQSSTDTLYRARKRNAFAYRSP